MAVNNILPMFINYKSFNSILKINQPNPSNFKFHINYTANLIRGIISIKDSGSYFLMADNFIARPWYCHLNMVIRDFDFVGFDNNNCFIKSFHKM